MTSGADFGPNLLLDWQESADPHRYWWAGAGSLIVHVVILALVVLLASLSGPAMRQGTEIIPDFHQAVHLILPADLTQKEPNKGKVAKEVDVEDLKPRPPSQQRLAPAPAVVFRPPNPRPPGPDQSPAPRIAEPPKIEAPVVAQNTPPIPPALAGTPKAPPPQIQPVEQPKLALETPGQQGPSEHKGEAKLAPPKTDIQSIVRDLARGKGGAGNIVVGDLDQPPDLPSSIRLPPSPNHTGSSLELRSDPMGVDFRPYLAQILALVRRNWAAVIPESVRLGNRGITQLVFTIDRNGQVPKLVIDTPSGAESLDRAAVAGISASVPFPPLPREFKGQQIILKFSFKYNF